MFSFQQGNELVFQIPSTSNPTIGQNLLVGKLHDPSHRITSNSTRKRPRDSWSLTMSGDPNRKVESTEHGDHDDVDDCDSKKKRLMMHREIEKQRRQDMAKLYSSLRSLLPFEFVKGKRSISDHMHQAVSYIKDMQQNIKLLTVKRDELIKKLPNTSSTTTTTSTTFVGREKNIVTGRSNSQPPNTVDVISSGQGGIEILINSDSYMDYQPRFLLSRLLKLLSQEGIRAVSCTCTKVNERVLLAIQAEVSDLTCIHLSVLQQKLSDVVHT